MFSASAVGAALLLAVVGRDLIIKPDNSSEPGAARPLPLFTYRYDRAWPESLDFSAILMGCHRRSRRVPLSRRSPGTRDHPVNGGSQGSAERRGRARGFEAAELVRGDRAGAGRCQEVGPRLPDAVALGEADDAKTEGPGSSPSPPVKRTYALVLRTRAGSHSSSWRRSPHEGARRCTSMRGGGMFGASGVTSTSLSAAGVTRPDGGATAETSAPLTPRDRPGECGTCGTRPTTCGERITECS